MALDDGTKPQEQTQCSSTHIKLEQQELCLAMHRVCSSPETIALLEKQPITPGSTYVQVSSFSTKVFHVHMEKIRSL